MSEDRREKKDLPSAQAVLPPVREEMTEIMKAHLDLIEGGSSHYSKWSSMA